ncbi:MAG: phosphatase PAP2 family protein [Verrucomicrobiaceae bacterium]|jgi:undecaprenyl-diphosphatase|nr:phosphatase PAP2 family protein [Verrucomicrobiaceae bacterium]
MPAWDIELLRLINQTWSADWLDHAMPAVSAIEAWMPPLVVIAFLLVLRGGRKARVMFLSVALAVGIGDAFVSNTLKKLVGRVRPRDAVEGVIVRDLGIASPPTMRLFVPPVKSASQPNGATNGKSFPSSHTVNMFAVATVVACFYRGAGIAIYGLAALVAWSRVYCGAHWPSDIPPSIALGVLTGLGVVWGLRRLAGPRVIVGQA